MQPVGQDTGCAAKRIERRPPTTGRESGSQPSGQFVNGMNVLVHISPHLPVVCSPCSLSQEQHDCPFGQASALVHVTGTSVVMKPSRVVPAPSATFCEQHVSLQVYLDLSALISSVGVKHTEAARSRVASASTAWRARILFGPQVRA
mmetsp:Transcript_7005/g.20375  ORF Transcript_7005/g.20375 Transcript_7005/m.20375 type:complete len:147 (-) Transcript_7005:42-482(-)